jgi:hypothetical protein
MTGGVPHQGDGPRGRHEPRDAEESCPASDLLDECLAAPRVSLLVKPAGVLMSASYSANEKNGTTRTSHGTWKTSLSTTMVLRICD